MIHLEFLPPPHLHRSSRIVSPLRAQIGEKANSFTLSPHFIIFTLKVSLATAFTEINLMYKRIQGIASKAFNVVVFCVQRNTHYLKYTKYVFCMNTVSFSTSLIFQNNLDLSLPSGSSISQYIWSCMIDFVLTHLDHHWGPLDGLTVILGEFWGS